MGKEGGIRIERVPVKTLCEFARSLDANTHSGDLNVLPIHRARAYARNPCADEADIGLLVAFMGEKPVGYLGIMPGQLKSAGKTSKVHWLTTWFVPEEFRDTAAGSLLMMTAISLRYDLLACAPDMGDEAQSVYRALGFKELGPLSFGRIEVERLNTLYRLLNAVQDRLNSIGASLPGIGRATRASVQLYKPLRQRLYRRLLKSIRADPADALTATEISDMDSSLLREPTESSPRFYRGHELLRWMLKDKWVLDRSETPGSGSSFFFSSVRDQFKYITLKLTESKEGGEGFLILSASSNKGERTLKVLDYQLPTGVSERSLGPIILERAQQADATLILLPAHLRDLFEGIPAMKSILSTGSIYYFARAGRKNSMLAAVLDDIRIDFCDGDLAFT